MALNLDGARRSVDKLFLDRCVIVRDPEGARDDVYDEATMQMVPATDDSKRVYSGKCVFTTKDLQSNEAKEYAGQEATDATYRIALPWNVPDMAIGDVITCTASKYDKTLQGRKFRVTAVTRTSFLVRRQATVQMLETPYG